MSNETQSQGEEHLLLPFERGASDEPSDEQSLFDLLDSAAGDLDFLDPNVEPPEEDESDTDDDDADEDEDDDELEDEGDEPEDDDELEDEDEDEDDDGEESDEEEVDDDDDGEDPDEAEQLWEVKVNGEIVEVTEQEMIDGYSREKDYTQKSQLREKEFSEEVGKTRAAREEYEERLGQVSEALKAMQPAEPDWDALRAENPAEFAAQKAEYAERENVIARVAQEQESVAAARQEELNAALRTHMQGQMAEMVTKVPSWGDEAVRAQEIEAIRAHATNEYGFTEQELAGVSDHRLLLIIRDNMNAQKSTSKGKKEIKAKRKGKRIMKPGNAKTRKSSRKRADKAKDLARDRATRTGDVRDIARAIEGYLDD